MNYDDIKAMNWSSLKAMATSPLLYRVLGIFLPLITTNCAILGLALFATNRGYGFWEGIVYALGAGMGFTLAMVLLALALPLRFRLAMWVVFLRGILGLVVKPIAAV